jgi:hypothetical protein
MRKNSDEERNQMWIFWLRHNFSGHQNTKWEVNADLLKRRHLRVTSRVPGRRDRDWSHVTRAPAQPAENVPTVSTSPPEAQFGEVPSLLEGHTVPRAYCVTWGANHWYREDWKPWGIGRPRRISTEVKALWAYALIALHFTNIRNRWQISWRRSRPFSVLQKCRPPSKH